MAGRIESYIHSDKHTPNKGGCLVEISCETDFAARTEEFIQFAKSVAQMAYGSQKGNWKSIVEIFPDLESARINLETKLKELVDVRKIYILNLTDEQQLYATRNGLK